MSRPLITSCIDIFTGSFLKLSIAVCLLVSQSIHGQTPIFNWVQKIGVNGTQNCYDIAIDPLNNVYITGSFTDTLDLDPGTGVAEFISEGNEDIFLAKYDSLGNYIWGISFGGNSNDVSYALTLDDSSNVYITGYFTGIVDFNPSSGVFQLTAQGTTDIFISKFDSSGQYIWSVQMGSNLPGLFISDVAYDITCDDLGNIYTTGKFIGTADFDPGPGNFNLTAIGEDVFVSKLNTNGEFIWAISFNGSGNDVGKNLCVDDMGNVYIVGEHFQTTDFDPGAGVFNLTSAGASDLFICKLDINGNFLWAVSMGNIDGGDARSITNDSLGNILVTGHFFGMVDFDPGMGVYNLSSNGVGGVYLLKLDANGNFIWANGFGDTGSFLTVSDIHVHLNDEVIICGGFSGSFVDFDPGLNTALNSSNGDSDVYFVKMDSSGNFLWVRTFGGTSTDNAYGFACEPSGSIYSTGSFENTVDFNPGINSYFLSSSSNSDIFIHKMGLCIESYSTDTVTACENFTWIDGITYTSSNNSSIYTFIDGNAEGCDSIVTLHLTIIALDNSVTQNDSVLIANATGVTYQWVDCNNNYSIISGETNQVFTASTNGNFAVLISDGFCTDTSSCYSVTTVSINNKPSFNDVLVFPNPTIGNLIIDAGTYFGKNSRAVVKNPLSQEVITEEFINSRFTKLTIENPPGVYFLEVVFPNDVILIYKIIKL